MKKSRHKRQDLGNKSEAIELEIVSDDLFWEHSLDSEARKVYFFDEINTVTALRLIKTMALLDKTEGAITLVINSDGGSVTDGWAICDFIKHMKNEVHGVVYGEASSMASVVLQACKTRAMAAHAYLLIHAGSATLEGDVRDIMSNSEHLKKDLEKTMDYYRARAKISSKKMSDMMSKETLLDAKDALKYGFIDMVLE